MMMSAATTIKKLRFEMCLEQEKFANLIGVSTQSISNYERGTRKPKLEVIKKIKELAKKNGIEMTTDDFLD